MLRNLNSPLESDFDGDMNQMLDFLKEMDPSMVVNPNQLKDFLENFNKAIEKLENGESKIVFPKGYMINKIDVGGTSVTDAITKLLKELGERKDAVDKKTQFKDISTSVKSAVDKTLRKTAKKGKRKSAR